MSDLVVAMTGASGAIYGIRLLQIGLSSGRQVHFTLSPAAVQVLQHELNVDFDLQKPDLPQLFAALDQPPYGAPAGGPAPDMQPLLPQLHYHHFQDFNAGIASGSFPTAGMVICPCSMGTLASLAGGVSSNLIHRAAGVHLKEGRKLIVVPRETPLGLIQLDNMRRLAEAGGVILPAMPGFYHEPQSISDLVDFVVARVCDQLQLPTDLIHRWGT